MRFSTAVLLLWTLSKVSYGRQLLCSSLCNCTLDAGKIPSAKCERFVMSRTASLPAVDINIQRLELSNCMVLTSRAKGCQSSERSVIPFGWFQRFINLTHITIKNCPVHRLPRFAFANLTRLLSLKLERLPLTVLDGSALHNAPSLRHLTLENMFCLSSLDQKLLTNKKHFQSLRLSGTNLREMSRLRLLLLEVRPSLRKFTWTKNQQQVTLPMRTFSDFKFKTLNLSFNKLTDVSFLYNVQTRRLILEGYNGNDQDLSKFNFASCFRLRKTRVLNLRSCGLYELNPDHFRGFTKLHTLLLGKNSIRQVDGRIFKRMVHLKKLELSDNLIESVPVSMKYLMQRKNFELDLSGNRLHCNCEIRWLLNYPAFSSEIYCASFTKRNEKVNLSRLRIIDLECKPPDPPVVKIEMLAPVKKGSRRNDYTAYFYTKVTKRITLRKDGQVTLNEGESIILRCISKGDPPPIMTWEIISNMGKVQKYPTRAQTYNSIEWRIRQTDMKFDRYIIQCRAKSKIGNAALNLTVFNSAPTITVPPIPSSTPMEIKRQVVGRLNASEGIYDSRTSIACSVRCSLTRTGIGLLVVVSLWRSQG